MGITKPVCSAIGINFSRGILPTIGLCQRSQAFAPVILALLLRNPIVDLCSGYQLNILIIYEKLHNKS
jgi:hypothetical protein